MKPAKVLTVGPEKLREWAGMQTLNWMASLRPIRKHLVAVRGAAKPVGCCGRGSRRAMAAIQVPTAVVAQAMADRRFQTDMRTLRYQLRLDRLIVKAGGTSMEF